MSAVAIVGSVFAIAGVALLLVAALGLVRLPDALARQHAATKSVTLALGLILVGLAVHQHGVDPALAAAWWARVAGILVLLLLTLPVASHMLARAAAREACSDAQLRASPRVEPEAERPDPPVSG